MLFHFRCNRIGRKNFHTLAELETPPKEYGTDQHLNRCFAQTSFACDYFYTLAKLIMYRVDQLSVELQFDRRLRTVEHLEDALGVRTEFARQCDRLFCNRCFLYLHICHSINPVVNRSFMNFVVGHEVVIILMINKPDRIHEIPLTFFAKD